MHIRVIDSNTFGSTLIGECSFDAVTIYGRDHHELHRQWIGLFHPVRTASREAGVEERLHVYVF